MTKSKLTSIALSLVIAFGLWLYVITNVSQETEYTIYNIPVVMEGESVLTERNLMITSISADDVDLTMSGNRSDLAKVNSGNMVLKADLTKIYEPEENKILPCNPVFPSDVPSNALTVQNRHPANIYITVEARRNKEVPVEGLHARWFHVRPGKPCAGLFQRDGRWSCLCGRPDRKSGDRS